MADWPDVNWPLIEELKAKGEHRHQRGPSPDVEYPNQGIPEILGEAVVAQLLLDMAGVPNDKGYAGDLDARTYLLVAKTSELRGRLDRIARWHTRETAPGGMVGDFCNECGHTWPCDTQRMAEGTYADYLEASAHTAIRSGESTDDDR